LIPGKNIKLIFKGSVDGFGAANFHAKCDNIANTLVVIRSEHGKVFGGYTFKTLNFFWLVKDANAFIFSLTNQKKFNVKPD
jgi:hypothetical protein